MGVKTDCTFNQYTQFNESKFNLLQIVQTKFLDISSFQDVNLNRIFIDTTSFDKLAFFDDIKINEVEECSKRTLRNIKHQLQRADNNIDYDIFKAYELNSHRKEFIKNNQYWFNNKDVFILSIGNLFSRNGMDWTRAFCVTFSGALIFYSVYYFIYYWSVINNYSFTGIELKKIDEFFHGYTNFIIPTNIYNPLSPQEFVKGISWFPFIFGKIFLSIGIYEIIKSFRKFTR